MTKHRRLLAFRFIMRSICLALVLLTSILSLAQTESATMSGTVMDRSGAVVADAKIEVTNSDTNVKTATVTNKSGTYVVTGLRPGRYRMAVSKEGFRSIVVTDITLNVQDTVSRNFNLDVGAFSESITVTANSINIDTTDASVSTVVDRQFAENLPLNGRSFQTLIQLTPGVVITVSNHADNGQFSINGQRPASNYWMVDGVSANVGTGVSGFISPGNGLSGSVGSFSAMGGTNSLVSVDAMQEFRIQTSTYAPEFGRTPAGQISIVTRSGANQFHGTVFDYLRNDVLDANDWFANNKGLPKPKERQNDFGGTFSGPILKDRTFFFFSYEGLRLRLPQVALTTVPDASFTPGGTTNSRQNAISPMQPFLNAFPLPNANSPEIFVACDPNTDPTCPPSGQKPTGSAGFNASYSNPSTLDAYSLRIDQKLGNKVNIFGRYNYSPSEIVQRGGAFALSVVGPSRITIQTATVGATWVISPSTTNDLRFNYSRTNASGTDHLDTFGGAVPLTSLPFPSSLTSQNGLLDFDIFSLLQGGFFVGKSVTNLQRQINIVDSFSRQEGSHSLKFGGDFRRLSPLYTPYAYQQAAFFNDVPSAQNGSLSFAAITSNLGPTFLFRNLGLYAQDTWRIVPRLTLTYGLRWDVDFVPRTIKGPSFNAVTGFNLTNLSNLALAAPGTPPYKTTYGNVAPRLGVAYQVRQSQDWQTVIRGGFGVFYDLATSEMGNNIGQGNFPFGGQTFLGGTFPFNPPPPPPPITPPTASNSGTLFAFDPHLELPYTLEWNIALEQALGSQQTLSASYIGAAGRRLLGSTQVGAPNPNLAFAQLVANVSTSDYDALQVQFQRRLSRGLQALASYTWSHSIDTGSAGSLAVGSNQLVPSAINGNRGPSDFDIRNSFSAGLTYDIPAPKLNALMNAILRGWSTENIILARSAPPVDIEDGNFFEFIGGIFAPIRPDLVPGTPFYFYGSQFPGGKRLNAAAFMDPPAAPPGPNCPFGGCPTRQGNVPRNFLRGFGATQWDFAVHRDFPIHESLKLQFRAELFNVLNHPNFGQPFGDFGFGNVGFGLSTQMLAQSLNGGGNGSNVGGGAFSPLYQIGGPRSMQFALKITF
jgi:hypothetical protein